MKTLVIYAHPDTGGHCATIYREVRNYLANNKMDFEILDLYKMKYDPVMPAEEHYTRGQKKISSQNMAIQKKIRDSDKLIFIYPIWWGSAPAILKGFFDRVFTSGYAFKYENGIPKGLLGPKKALIFLTTGAHSVLSQLFQGGRPQKGIALDVLKFCGIKSRVKQFGGSNRFDENREKLIVEVVAKEMKKFL